MKFSCLALIIAIFFVGLTIYMVRDVVNPLQETKVKELAELYKLEKPIEVYNALGELEHRGIILEYVSPQRLILVLGVAFLAIFCVFIAIHMFIDKLFFKEFYRPPNIKLAVRRGIFLLIALVIFWWLRFLGVLYWQLLSVPLVLILVEILLWNIHRTRQHKTEDAIIKSDIIDPEVPVEDAAEDEGEENEEGE